MKDHIVITIGRTYGSGGRKIGEKLAKELGISFYDKNLIAIAAEKTGIDENLLDSADEKILNRFLDPYAAAGGMGGDINQKLYLAECKIIRELAIKESCVIVGRLADYVLRDDPNCLKIFIDAPLEKRIETIMKRHCLSEAEARRLVKQTDKNRKSYYYYFSERRWNSTEGRDLMINSDQFGVEGTIDIIKYVAEHF